MCGKGMALARWALLAAAVLLGGLHYRGMLASVVTHVLNPEEEMLYALLAPAVSLLTMVGQRKRFRRAAGLPSRRGFGWVLAFLALAWLGARGGYERVSQVSMIGLIWSVPFALWGKGVGKLMLFPAWFLLFTVPVASPAFDAFKLSLRTFDSEAAACILAGFGAKVSCEETVIWSGRYLGDGFSLNVLDACSGVRSLSVMLLLTAAYAHFFLKSRTNRWVLLACSAPIAIIGNILRIISVATVALHSGEGAAFEFYHTYSGYVFFLACVFMMLCAEECVKKIRRRG